MYKLKYMNMVDKTPLYKQKQYQQPRISEVDQLDCNQAWYLE